MGERESVGALLARNVARFGSHAVYSERRDGAFRAVSWEAFARDVASFGAFLSAAGTRPGTRVAVVSPNRGEMLVAEFATMSLGATYVPIFAGYPAHQVRGLLRQADPAVLIVAGLDQLAGVHFGETPSATSRFAMRSRGSPPTSRASPRFSTRRRTSIPASPACSTSPRARAAC